jgi:hypothetical protein
VPIFGLGPDAIPFPEPLLIHQQRQAFLETELTRTRSFQLRAESIRHAVWFLGMQFFDGLLIEPETPFYA